MEILLWIRDGNILRKPKGLTGRSPLRDSGWIHRSSSSSPLLVDACGGRVGGRSAARRAALDERGASERNGRKNGGRFMARKKSNVPSGSTFPSVGSVGGDGEEGGKTAQELACLLLSEEWLDRVDQGGSTRSLFTNNSLHPGVDYARCSDFHVNQTCQNPPKTTQLETTADPVTELEWLDDILASEFLSQNDAIIGIHESNVSDLEGFLHFPKSVPLTGVIEGNSFDTTHANIMERGQSHVEGYQLFQGQLQPVPKGIQISGTASYNNEEKNWGFQERSASQCSHLYVPPARTKQDPGKLKMDCTIDPFENVEMKLEDGKFPHPTGDRKNDSYWKISNQDMNRKGSKQEAVHPKTRHRALNEKKRLANRRAAARSHIKKTLTSKLLRVEHSEQQKRLQELRNEKENIETEIAAAEEELQLPFGNTISKNAAWQPVGESSRTPDG